MHHLLQFGICFINCELLRQYVLTHFSDDFLLLQVYNFTYKIIVFSILVDIKVTSFVIKF